MNNLNSVLLEGNLIRDPELRETNSGTPVCTLVIASNRYYTKDDERQEEVSFLEIVAWSRLAEVCAEYLKKGRGIRAVGRLKQDRWEDGDGQNRSKVRIIAEHIEFKPERRESPDEATTTNTEAGGDGSASREATAAL